MNFDIDLVYLWVNGEDSDWIVKLLTEKKENLTEEAVSKCRFQDNNELKYSLRSVKKYAHCIRNIFIVTDNQIPEWLNPESERIKIIDHKDIMPESARPSFNSCAIETCLSKIP